MHNNTNINTNSSPRAINMQLPSIHTDPYLQELLKKQSEQEKVVESLKFQLTNKNNSNLNDISKQSQQQSSPRITDLKQLNKQLQEQRQARIKSFKVKDHNFGGRQRSAESNNRNINYKTFNCESSKEQKLVNMQQLQRTAYTAQTYHDQTKDKPNEQIDCIIDLQNQMGITEKQIEKIHLKSTLLDMLPVEIRKFFYSEKNFIRVIRYYDVVNYCFTEVNEKVRCHRYELGLLLDKIGSAFYKIFDQLLSSTLTLRNELEKKYENIIKEYSNQIERIEKDKQLVDQNFNNLKKRYIVQENLYKITKINSDSLQNEIILLHDMLKKDVDKMMGHLSNLEAQQAKQHQQQAPKDDPAENMMTAVSDLGNIIVNLDCEQEAKDNMISTMGGLLKAMLKGSKKEVSTQVDDGQLAWSYQQLNGTQQNVLVFDQDLDRQAVNLPENFKDLQKNSTQSNLDLAKKKEQQFIQSQPVVTNKKQVQSFNITDNWSLPITIIVLLENVSKTADTGRVIPWNHFREQLFDIYKDYLQNQWEIRGSIQGTYTTLDEYLCLYFLKTCKLRLACEHKLFEFLVSLRYYIKSQSRASMFALLCNITSFPNGNPNDVTFPYNFDIYVQSYFFYVFEKLVNNWKFVFSNDSGAYINQTNALDLAEQIMKYASEASKHRVLKRIRVKCQKNAQQNVVEQTPQQVVANQPQQLQTTGQQQHTTGQSQLIQQTQLVRQTQNQTQEQTSVECIDVDQFLDLFIEEYFESRKGIMKNIVKNFSNAYEHEQGVFSIDSLKNIVKDSYFQQSALENFRFPKDIMLAKAFLYSLTSDKNKYEVISQYFIKSCNRFGLDSPFPYIRSLSTIPLPQLISQDSSQVQAYPPNLNSIDQKNVSTEQKQDSINSMEKQSSINQKAISNKPQADSSIQTIQKDSQGVKMEAVSTIFAQHYSLLRELRTQCLKFKDQYEEEQDKVQLQGSSQLWGKFTNIVNILETGCQFLNFPINI